MVPIGLVISEEKIFEKVYDGRQVNRVKIISTERSNYHAILKKI
jgi:hypothetical protein